MKKRILSFFMVVVMMLGTFTCLSSISTCEVQAVTANQANIAARANYFYNAEWICQRTISGWRGNYTFYQGSTYKAPYGQPVDSGRYIGFTTGNAVDDGSIFGWLVSTGDPNSEFYTRQSSYNGKIAPYYATDCSAFVSWCWGVSRRTTASIPNISTNLGMATAGNNYGIQVGDALNSNSAGHVVLVTGVGYDASGNVAHIEITEQTPPQLKRTAYTPESLAAKYGSSYTIQRYYGDVPASPDGASMSSGPMGSFDEATGGPNSVHVRGWGVDPDDFGKDIEIHVYIGTAPNHEGHIIRANTERTDVNDVHGCGTNHGFDATIATALTGWQEVNVYAIDLTGQNDNTHLGTKIVDISQDTEAPVLGDIVMSETNDKGYTVICAVEDNGAIGKCYFPTWTEENPDNKIWYEGWVFGGLAGCTINVADFGNYQGKYETHFYAYDGNNNCTAKTDFTLNYANPVGFFDGATLEGDGMRVKGWAFDSSTIDEAIEVHIYIGGQAGDPAAEGHIIKADKLREDVGAANGCGDYHGFDEVIETAKTGTQEVHAYAINTGGGGNTYLGSKVIDNLPGDKKAPEITDIRIHSTDSKGYTIACEFKDNVRVTKVLFPTWTEENPDNKIWIEGWVLDGVAYGYVNVEEQFGGYNGNYVTHAYAYDASENFDTEEIKSSFNMPIGAVDFVEDKHGAVRVGGWALDGDALDEALEVHVYVGAPAGDENAEFFKITADGLREDIGDFFGCGDYHGYEAIIPTTKTGEQTVYIYALNKGNGDNVFLGSKTITLSEPLKGDMDRNGEVNIIDVTRLQNTLAGLSDNSAFDWVGDVNGNGKLDIRDATYLQLYIAKVIDKLPT